MLHDLTTQVLHLSRSTSKYGRFLEKNIMGPELKSFWPNKVRDLLQFSNRAVSSEIPIDRNLTDSFNGHLKFAAQNIPIQLFHISRENMTGWRSRRGAVKLKGFSFINYLISDIIGEAKITTSKMGK